MDVLLTGVHLDVVVGEGDGGEGEDGAPNRVLDDDGDGVLSEDGTIGKVEDSVDDETKQDGVHLQIIFIVLVGNPYKEEQTQSQSEVGKDGVPHGDLEGLFLDLFYGALPLEMDER